MEPPAGREHRRRVWLSPGFFTPTLPHALSKQLDVKNAWSALHFWTSRSDVAFFNT
jgi:hypothetical protein